MTDRVPGREGAHPTHVRRGIRMLMVAAGLAVLAAGSSGCVIVRDDLISQPSLIGGEFTLNVRACVSNGGAACPSAGSSNIVPNSGSGATVQVLGGILMPSGYSPPQVLSRTDPSSPITGFTRSPSYEAELTRLLPPPEGQRWFGYVSDPFTTFVGGATYGQRMTITRARSADGEPIPALRGASYVAGGRLVTPEAPATRPVDCADGGTICVDSRLDRTEPALHDLALQAPPTVTAAPGTTAVIPVTARFAGVAAPEFSFSLNATTTLPGAPATVNVPTLTPPTDSTSSVSVSVPVPADAAPGQYPVTVTATVGGPGTSVSTTATLVVPAPPAIVARPPAVSLRATRVTARVARTRGIPVRVTTDTATSATVAVTQRRRVRVGRRVVVRAVRLVGRTVTLPVGTTTVRLRTGAFRPGTATVQLTGAGFSARTSVVLR